MSRTCFRPPALLLAILAGASAASAQQAESAPPISPASQEASDLTTLKLSTRLRVLDVTVLDKQGNPVTTNLTKDDFTILDDKHKKEIFSFDGPNGAPGVAALPTSNIFVVDHVNTQFEDESWQMQQLERYFQSQGDLLNQQTELLLFTDNGLQVVASSARVAFRPTSAAPQTSSLSPASPSSSSFPPFASPEVFSRAARSIHFPPPSTRSTAVPRLPSRPLRLIPSLPAST